MPTRPSEQGRFDHVLLTRFNLPSAGVESLIRAQDGWLRGRVALFERYTLPSVAAQSCRDFSWLVFFDRESPDWLRQKIQGWSADGALVPVFCEEMPRPALLAELRRVTGASRPELITTNLDNDDGLATDFVAALQQAGGPDGRVAIYRRHGLISSADGVYLRLDRRNAFCSVRESWADAETCWSEWHNLLGDRMPVVEVDGPPGWLQVVHGSNVSNRVHGRLTDPRRYAASFAGLLDGAPVPTAAALAADALLRRPSRAARDTLRRTAKNLLVRVVGKDGLDRLKLRLGGPAHSSGRQPA